MDWVAFDLETTGLGDWSRPVEIGARRFQADGTVWDFQTLVRPDVPIPFGVTQIHGITEAMVRDAPDVRKALERFFTFAEGAALVAHNARFDAGIVAHSAARLGLEPPHAPVHDTVRLARRLLPHLWSYRLAHIARSLNLECERFHRALPDAGVVGQLVHRLMGLRPHGLAGFPRWSVGWLGVLPDFGPVKMPEFRQRTAPVSGLVPVA